MTLSTDLIVDIKDAEGCRLTAYKDTLGFWTVAYGHKLAEGKDWTGYTVSQDTASALLTLDLNEAAILASELPEWRALDCPARQDALIELVFNMGQQKWRKFVKCRAALSDQNWTMAANELLNSLWAHQVGPTRSNRIANQILKGTYV